MIERRYNIIQWRRLMSRFFLWLVAVIVVFLSSRVFYSLYYNYSQAAMSLLAVEFEVFGKVQGVFFRKYTNEKALRKGANLKYHLYLTKPFGTIIS